MIKLSRKETQEEIGSRTAKGGFKNERFIANKFNDWKNDLDARFWLQKIIDRDTIDNLQSVSCNVLGKRTKADLELVIKLKSNEILVEYLSLKKQDKQGYNHVGRNNVDYYQELFHFSPTTLFALKKFCGEEGYSPHDLYKSKKISYDQYRRFRDIPEKKSHKEGTGRFFIDELTREERESILADFSNKMKDIIEEIIKGRTHPKPKWLLVTKKIDDNLYYHLETTDEAVIRALNNKTIAEIGPRKGTFILGHIRVQRKGGTGGATQLQFKWKNPFP